MGRGEEDFARQHRTNIDQFVLQVYRLYLQAAQDAIRMGLSVNHDTNKPFSFGLYPGLRERVNKLLAKLAADVVTVINAGTKTEWLLADQKNDELVKRLFPKSMPVELGRRFLGRNLEALRAFQNRKADGMSLSERVWKYTGTFRSEMEMALDMGILEGRSAADLSRDVRQYLEDPDRLYRRVRDARGVLHLSKAAENYEPGQGVYRSSYKNAARLTRTEINMAYRESDHTRWQQLDFVVGFEVRRSNNPYPCPVCESLKGRYPKNFKFRGWHPQCRCHAVSILATQEEMDRLTEMILNDEDMNTFRSVNEVKHMPEGYVNWISNNKTRLLSAKSTPYFIRDNYKDGSLTKGLRFAVAKAPKPVPILHKGKITREIDGEVALNELIGAYAARYPKDFSRGYKHTKVTQSNEYLMAAYPDGRFLISDHTFGDFNAYRDLTGALNKIRLGQNLKFKEEYAIEALYHEILHQKATGREGLKPHYRGDYKRTAMEVANQFVARSDYPILIERLGGKARHQKRVLAQGMGYRTWVQRLRHIISVSGSKEAAVLKKIRPILLERPYSKIDSGLSGIIREIGGVSLSDSEILSAIEGGGAGYRRLLRSIRKSRGNR